MDARTYPVPVPVFWSVICTLYTYASVCGVSVVLVVRCSSLIICICDTAISVD